MVIPAEVLQALQDPASAKVVNGEIQLYSSVTWPRKEHVSHIQQNTVTRLKMSEREVALCLKVLDLNKTSRAFADFVGR